VDTRFSSCALSEGTRIKRAASMPVEAALGFGRTTLFGSRPTVSRLSVNDKRKGSRP
jgi:hypothetical protein